MKPYSAERFGKKPMLARDKITAKVIKKSTCSNGSSLVTFSLHYPRFIHSELLTHCLLSRNSSSSRAIPLSRSLEYVAECPAEPVHWGKNQPGMVANEEIDANSQTLAKKEWLESLEEVSNRVRNLSALGVHKQVANRLMEPYMFMNTIVSATELANFYYLRRNDGEYKDAQPELAELAEKMFQADQEAEVTELTAGQWHVPFVDFNPKRNSYCLNGEPLDTALALRVSASICAQVSYRRQDESLDKALQIWERLITSSRVHASPCQHQGSPILLGPEDDWKSVPGISHMDNRGNYWSGNFKGWIQFRKTLEREAVW